MNIIVDNFEKVIILTLENWSFFFVLQSKTSSVVIKMMYSDKDSTTIIMLQEISCSKLFYKSTKAFSVNE